MRVTLLGHTSVLVEMAGAACLMDPAFFDPFEEGRSSHVRRALSIPSAFPIDSDYTPCAACVCPRCSARQVRARLVAETAGRRLSESPPIER